MNDEIKKSGTPQNNVDNNVENKNNTSESSKFQKSNRTFGGNRSFGKGGNTGSKFSGKPRDDRKGGRRNTIKSPTSNLFSKVLSVDRVGKTNAGGKVISFSAFSVIGDENGSVGVGLGKSKEVSSAIEKSKNVAMKNMFKISSAYDLESIPHNVETKFKGTRVFLRKGKKGHIASNLAKNIFKAAGLKNMVSKALGARSVKNTAYAIIESLKKVESLEMIAERRSMTVKELLARKRNVIHYGLSRQNASKKKI